MPTPDERDDLPGAFGELPGDFMMWVLIASELLVFGGALLSFMSVRAGNPEAFAADQALLNQTAGAINTIILVTSGFFAALAAQARAANERTATRRWLYGAMLLGTVFLLVKAAEYWSKAQLGIGIETSPFFMFYYLVTGFHALHVVAGIAILGLVAWKDTERNVETAAAFWHMVDLVWVLLFPIVYLLR